MQQFRPTRILFAQGAQAGSVGAVLLPRFAIRLRRLITQQRLWPTASRARKFLGTAVQRQFRRGTGASRKTADFRRAVHGVLGHFAVGRPFPAGDRDPSGWKWTTYR